MADKLTYSSYSNPKFFTSDGSIITCVLHNAVINGTRLGDIPFGASSHDVAQHGQDLHTAITANSAAIPIAPHVQSMPPTPTIPQQASLVLRRPTTALIVTCTSKPELSGAYRVSGGAADYMTTIASAFAAGLGLPSGQETFIFPDERGVARDWPGDKFMLLVKGALQYRYQLKLVAGGTGDVLPHPLLTIP